MYLGKREGCIFRIGIEIFLIKFTESIFINPARQIKSIFSFFKRFRARFSKYDLVLNLIVKFFMFDLAAILIPLALGLFEITKTILIKDFFLFEYLINDFKLLPLPLIRTATFFYQDIFPLNFTFLNSLLFFL